MNTYILKWNPAISCFKMEDMHYEINEAWDSLDTDFNWSIYEWEKAQKGDRIFFLRVGRGKTGIIASGWLSSAPYMDDDWRNSEKKSYYADVIFDVMTYPRQNNILDTKILQKEIPSVDWKGGHSGVSVTAEEANALELLWKKFLNQNKKQFEPNSNNTFHSLLIRAWGIAFNAHKGQVDKNGNDYFETHIMDVYHTVTPLYDEDDNLCITEIVALLHDVIEDTDWNIDQLRNEGFTDDILEALSCITKQKDEDYQHFIERIKHNRFAKAVKIADLTNNMDITRLNDITDADVERLRKYHKAYKLLTSKQP